MFTCYIIDDAQTAAVLSQYISTITGIRIAGTSDDAAKGCNMVRQVNPDILFADASFVKQKLNLFRQLFAGRAAVITSNDTEFAYQAYKLTIVDYLVKPIGYSNLLLTFLKIQNRKILELRQNTGVQRNYKSYFFIKSGTKSSTLNRIAFSDVVYVEALENYVRFHLETAPTVTSYLTLTEAESMLAGNGFVRINKGQIINIDKIKSIEGHIVKLSDDQSYEVGPVYRDALAEEIKPKVISTHRNRQK